MQIHTFIAESAGEAVEQIRSQLGPDAVVLSVRKLPRSGVSRLLKKEQIEVTAGIEEKPAPAPLDPIAQIQAEIRALRVQLHSRNSRGNETHLPQPRIVKSESRHPECAANESTISSLLSRSGLMPIFVERVLAEVAVCDFESAPLPVQMETVSQTLRELWKGDAVRSEAGVHVFVGVPGSGKSTVLCKMLAQANLAEAQPATVYQLDTLVTNNSPQPGLYSEILGAQFERTLPGRFEWSEQSVFIDLPGIGLGDLRGLEAAKSLLESFGMPEIHLVLNAAYESAHLLEQIRFFSALGISDLIVTHLDEEQHWGKLWNLVLGTNYSVRFLSSGQNIPGDFHPATAEALLGRQFFGK